MTQYTEEERYLRWLYELVGGEYGPCANYYNLMRTLQDVDFSWFINYDDNRASDGIELRYIYCEEYDIRLEEIPELYYKKRCSVLEMMVGLARRMEIDIFYSSEDEDHTSSLFKMMIDNLCLSDCNDLTWDVEKESRVIYTAHRLNNRTYDYSGFGGLFPLKNAREDQRKVEIWKQMSGFLYENDL